MLGRRSHWRTSWMRRGRSGRRTASRPPPGMRLPAALRSAFSASTPAPLPRCALIISQTAGHVFSAGQSCVVANCHLHVLPSKVHVQEHLWLAVVMPTVMLLIPDADPIQWCFCASLMSSELLVGYSRSGTAPLTAVLLVLPSALWPRVTCTFDTLCMVC